MKKDVVIVVVGVALLALIWIGWPRFEAWRAHVSSEGPTACTLEAKLCSDGSYVGRTGPKCEFARCPNE